MKTLSLFFPQWQGSGDKSLYNSAVFLRNELKERTDFIDVPLSFQEDVLKNNILGYDAIFEQLQSVRNILKDKNPDKVFVLGGDCSVDIAPISYLNKKYNNKLGVVWLDAHGDLNTPESSLSKHFHGMPLRVLLDEGDKSVLDSCFSFLNHHQVVLAGTRDLDAPEKDFIKTKQIKVVFGENVISEATSHFKSIGISNICVHIDLDVLNPLEFPFVKCQTQGGFSIENLGKIIDELREEFNIVGQSILEYCSLDGKGKEIVHKLLPDYLL